MSFGNTPCDDLRRTNEHLREELDRERDYRREEQEAAYEREEARRRERRQAYEDNLHYADGWTDAFSHGLILYGREARQEIKFNTERPGETPDTWFQDQIAPIELAQKLYREKMRPVRERIERITKMLEERALKEIAAEVEKQYPDATVIGSLRENRPNDLVEW